MIDFNRKLLTLCLLAGLVFLIPACSDDDDPTDPGGGGNGDTTAPQVTGINPDEGQMMVDTNPLIMISFNEAMDPDSADGQVTLSPAADGVTSWATDQELMFQPSNLPQATNVTVTVGTGLTDVAGNKLAKAVVSSFWTYAEVVTVLDFEPGDGATGVNRSASIDLLFSEPMNMGSLETGITISDGTKANHPFTVESADNFRYELKPVESLNPNTLTTVTLTTAVQTQGGDFFPEAVSFSFTTNEVIDSTPPTIVSIDPPSGSTIPTDQVAVVIVFSEPMDTQNFSPTMMNGQFAWVINQISGDISWSPDGTTINVPMPGDLPAGLPLEVRFAGYSDANGNVQPEETAWTVTVAGTADPYPVSDGHRWMATGTWAEGLAGQTDPTNSGDETIYYEFTARQTANQWNRREFYDPEYSFLDYYDIQTVTGSAVSLTGFAENDEVAKVFTEYFLSNPLTQVELPLVLGNTWSSSATVTIPEGTVSAQMDGEVTGQVDLPFGGGGGNFQIIWTDVWRVAVDISVSTGGEVFTEESTVYWVAPGIGVVRESYREDNLDPQNPGWYESDRWLFLDLN